MTNFIIFLIGPTITLLLFWFNVGTRFESLKVIENLQNKPSLKRLELEECPDCHVELGSGVTRCWNGGCKYTVPDGFVAVSKGYDG